MSSIVQLLASSTGFLSDSYDIFAINLIVTILSDISPLSATAKALIIMSCTAGTIAGQISLGWVSDHIGRQKTMILNAFILICATIGAASTISPFDTAGLTLFCCFRFLMGVGIGGDYAAASTFISESSNSIQWRGARISAVFSMQGFGAFLSTLIGYVLLAAGIETTLVWRLILACGLVPSLVAIGFRFYHFCASKDQKPDEQPDPIPFKQITKKVWQRFAGTSINWFLLDIVFYGNSLLSSGLVALFVKDASLTQVAAYTCLLATIALPGYWVAIGLIGVKAIGRFKLQLGGFIGLVILYSILAGTYDKLTNDHSMLAVLLYAITFFISNAGPNTTTFVIPAEVFPARLRGRFHGMSAASGKLGALVGSCMFLC